FAQKTPHDEEQEDIPHELKDAEDLFREGREKLMSGDVATACHLIEESQRIEPTPGKLHTLAQGDARQGRLATAGAHFKQFIQAAAAAPPSKRFRYKARVQHAEARRAELEPLTPRLTLILPPTAPWTTVVKLDGALIELSTINAAHLVDPG